MMWPSSRERSMDSSALANAESWLYWIGIAKLVAAFLVVTGVAIEFGGDWVARPFEKVVAHARELELAKLAKETSDAKLELEKYRAPRFLTNEQINRIQEEVKPFAPAEYAIGVSMDDPEQIHVADLIAIALKLAGWKQVDWHSDPIGRTMWGKIGKIPVPGNVIISPAPQDKSDAAKSLVDALNAEGIVATLTEHPVLMPFPGIKIMIGKKL
jgi:hypothetical protein